MKRFFLVSMIWVIFCCYAVYLGFTKGGRTPWFQKKIQGKSHSSSHSHGHATVHSHEHKHEVYYTDDDEYHVTNISRELSLKHSKSKARHAKEFTSDDESSDEEY